MFLQRPSCNLNSCHEKLLLLCILKSMNRINFKNINHRHILNYLLSTCDATNTRDNFHQHTTGKVTHVTCILQSNGMELIFVNYGILDIWIQ